MLRLVLVIKVFALSFSCALFWIQQSKTPSLALFLMKKNQRKRFKRYTNRANLPWIITILLEIASMSTRTAGILHCSFTKQKSLLRGQPVIQSFQRALLVVFTARLLSYTRLVSERIIQKKAIKSLNKN